MGEGVWRWGKREIMYLSLHCHHQNDFCIKVGSDEGHFNGVVFEAKALRKANSEHRFTTSFLQPLPYLVTP